MVDKIPWWTKFGRSDRTLATTWFLTYMDELWSIWPYFIHFWGLIKKSTWKRLFSMHLKANATLPQLSSCKYRKKFRLWIWPMLTTVFQRHTWNHTILLKFFNFFKSSYYFNPNKTDWQYRYQNLKKKFALLVYLTHFEEHFSDRISSGILKLK